LIKAITFDLWDTVFINDSDEPKRKAAGWSPKPVERRQLVKKFVEKKSPVSMELVQAVYNAADAAFNKVWFEQHNTWSVQERLDIVFKGIGIKLSDSDMKVLVRLHEEMELEFCPDFIPGVHEAIKSLHQKYKLGVISDTIFSPGRALRKLLEGEDLLKYFDVLIFSDEIGCSKPEPDIFEAACNGLGVRFRELVHIGDREQNDIVGPQEMGIRAVLCTAAVDRGSDNTLADAVFKNYSDLPEIIEKMNSEQAST
jgi:HAD superfamily hydrolase (TIGR01549 family)